MGPTGNDGNDAAVEDHEVFYINGLIEGDANTGHFFYGDQTPTIDDGVKIGEVTIEGEFADKMEITAIAHLGLADKNSTTHVMIAVFQTDPPLSGGMSEFALATAWAKYIGPGVVTVNLHYLWPIGLPGGGWDGAIPHSPTSCAPTLALV